MKKFSLTFLLLVVCFQCLSYSQQPPCMPDYYGLTYSYPKYSHLPNYSTDMPYEVMLGYIVMDSVCKYGNGIMFDEFLNRQTYNDTIKKIMNFIYRMTDWDPYLFKRTQYYDESQINGYYYLSPKTIVSELIEKAAILSSNYKLNKLLLESDYILHAFILDTITRQTLSAEILKDLAIVNYQVLDTIKGKRIPTCKNISLNQYRDSEEKKDNLLESNNCSQFEFRLGWERKSEFSDVVVLGNSENSLVDSTGKIWTKKGQEYILCLQIIPLCRDNHKDYCVIYPKVIASLTCTMYPIENGKVQDPGNEFGFGSSVEINLFKTTLRQKINEILNY